MRLAKQCGTSPTSVILAAFADSLQQTFGMESVPMGASFSNRMAEKSRDCVAAVAQWMPLSIARSANTTFPDLVRDVHLAALRTYALGSHNIDDVADAIGVPVWNVTGLGLRFAFNYIANSIVGSLSDTFEEHQNIEWVEWESSVYRACYLKVTDWNNSWMIDFTGPAEHRAALEEVLVHMNARLASDAP
jgi:hypothetical protein